MTRLAWRPAAAALAAAGLALLPLAAAGCRDRGGAVGPPSAAGAPGEIGDARSLLLVTIDTLRADTLGFAGHERVETPTLDRLAAAGRVFTNAHTHYPLTLPAHASILTGLYPYQNGVRENVGFVLPAGVPTLAGLLKERGFATAAFVGAFPLDAQFGLNRGFDVYDDRYPEADGESLDVAQRRGDEVVAGALEWWRQRQGERRFLWVHVYDPHRPYDPPEPFATRYRDDPYLGEVAATDHFLTPLLAPFLDGSEGPALVAVVADHGEGLGEHGELTHGIFAYEPTLKVPLVLWGPGVDRGTDDRLARHVDLLPTLLAAAGLPVPEGLPGRSLLAPAPEGEVTSYFEALSGTLNRGWAPLRGVIRGPHKLIRLPLPELYDLASDPREADNLIDRERRTVHALGEALPAESSWPPVRGSFTPEVEANLKSLGYLVDAAPAKDAYGEADDPKKLMGLDRKLHEVLDLYGKGQLEPAVVLLREVIAERPTMPTAYSYLAQLLLDLGRPGQAIEVMQRARAMKVASDLTLRQLGLTLTWVGRPQEAIEILRPLAEKGDVGAMNALGTALNDAGRPQEAVAVLERVFAVDPVNAAAHENLAVAALRMQRWADARSHAEKALAINPGLANSWNNLGVALYYQGEPRPALTAWQRAVTLDPSQYDTLYNIGLKANELGETAMAREALRRFVATAPPARYGADIRQAQGLLAQLGG